jgi:hypothetical protein
MQLILSQEVPFLTSDIDLRKKLSAHMNCQVIHCDCEAGCIVAAMRLVNMNLMTADKVAQALSSDVQQAALVHEIAHAALHRQPVVLIDPVYRIPLSEEIVADLLVCRWGFFSELRQERIVSVGARYCEILELWPRKEELIHEMTIWYLTWLSGVPGER